MGQMNEVYDSLYVWGGVKMHHQSITATFYKIFNLMSQNMDCHVLDLANIRFVLLTSV